MFIKNLHYNFKTTFVFVFTFFVHNIWVGVIKFYVILIHIMLKIVTKL